MRISSTRDNSKFYIDWWLMNHNSRKASYEHDLLHCGNIDLPYLKDCKRLIEQSTLHSQKLGKQVHINFTGGEVTEWIDFDDLVIYAKHQNCTVNFVTNGFAEISRYENLSAYIESMIIEIHPEFLSPARILFLLSKLYEKNIRLQVNFNMLPNFWNELSDLHQFIQNKYPNITLVKKILFEDPIFNTTPKDYDQDQKDEFKSQGADLKIEQQDQVEFTSIQNLILEKRNQFKNFYCYAGVEQIIVDAWGAVFRSHCRKNGFMGYLKDPDLFWYTEPMLCKLDFCVNQFDILTTKLSNQSS